MPNITRPPGLDDTTYGLWEDPVQTLWVGAIETIHHFDPENKLWGNLRIPVRTGPV